MHPNLRRQKTNPRMAAPVSQRVYFLQQGCSEPGATSNSNKIKEFQRKQQACWQIMHQMLGGKGDGSVILSPLLVEERRVLLMALSSGVLSSLQLALGFSIPFLWAGLLGSSTLLLSVMLAREVWMRRVKHLHYVRAICAVICHLFFTVHWVRIPLQAIFTPIPIVLLEYVIYVFLAEALDEDMYKLADEDDLERSIQSNSFDRWSAVAAIFLNLMLVVISFVIACAVLALRSVYRGQQLDVEQPWVLQLIAVIQDVGLSHSQIEHGLECAAPSATSLNARSVRGQTITNVAACDTSRHAVSMPAPQQPSHRTFGSGTIIGWFQKLSLPGLGRAEHAQNAEQDQ